MYLDDELIDQTLLSFRAMQDSALRDAYLQGAISEMLEKWDEHIKTQQVKPSFYIQGTLSL